ncbi:MAG: NUDIX domain-containing protein [Christensenellales bacterium]
MDISSRSKIKNSITECAPSSSRRIRFWRCVTNVLRIFTCRRKGKMGETAEQAVIREVWEELSVTPKIGPPVVAQSGVFYRGCGRPLSRTVPLLSDGFLTRI